jgi:thiol-disulfide isomerase/thioredoxin
MRLLAATLLLNLPITPTLSAQDDARDLIKRVVKTYQEAVTYNFETVTDSFITGDIHHSWSRRTDALAKDETGRVRWTTVSMNGSFAVVSDGKTAWIASIDNREFIRASLGGPLLDLKSGGPWATFALRVLSREMTGLDRLDRDLRTAEVTGRASLDVDGVAIECLVIHAVYDPPKGATGIESMTRSLWIDPVRCIVLREEIVTRGKLFLSRPYEEVEDRSVKRYTKAVVGQPLPASVFTYTPPRNFSEVDKLERPGPRPAVELKGKPAPDPSLEDLNGVARKISDLRGKIVLLDFWATWCAPCRTQMPALAKLNKEIRDQGVVLVGINDDETPEAAKAYLAKGGYGWMQLYDGKQKDARAKFKVTAIPTLVLIDRDGVITEIQIGSGDAVEAAIRSALRRLGVSLH